MTRHAGFAAAWAAPPDLAEGLPAVHAGHWVIAVAPVVVLLALVVWGRWSTAVNGLITLVTAAALAAAFFGAGPQALLVGVGKGLWVGVWILCVVVAALFLHHCTTRMGLERSGGVLRRILPRDVENVLVVAWIFASLVQGVAGFGVPIAVAAPLLVTMGVRPVLAVALPLIGYHWSVGFGSMGSSFYMGALTASLDAEQTVAYAKDSAILLGVNALIAGVLVALVYGGWREVARAWRVLAVCGPLMVTAQYLAAHIEPAIGSLAAGAAGILGVTLLHFLTRHQRQPILDAPTSAASEAQGASGRSSSNVSMRSTPAMASQKSVNAGSQPSGQADDTIQTSNGRGAPDQGEVEPKTASPAMVFLPYALLFAVALAVYLPTPSREWVKTHLLAGPSFPSTQTSYGLVNPPVDTYTPIALLGHPATYIVLAALLALMVWRIRGIWPKGALRPTLGTWARQVRKSAASLLALTAVANLMTDTGMVRMVAVGIAEAIGPFYPLAAAAIGCLGAFLTGSTTSSNALFASLQRDVAGQIGVSPSSLLAAQLAGGNIGNSLAPVTTLIGAVSLGDRTITGAVFRQAVRVAWVLLAITALLTVVLITR
ncbi:L-lactate permease [Sinosporangium siamense]|uniref:L-lactate permease n=1 Tax=Sinosporangium siamense TaxID=1367973 RepID=A0A919RR83_9ACTN|nr:L-lactate permease [Sinosporangium siamense]GII97001.1 hypothetical protein Ssi02_72320 [Sinosporangium siamense]